MVLEMEKAVPLQGNRPEDEQQLLVPQEEILTDLPLPQMRSMGMKISRDDESPGSFQRRSNEPFYERQGSSQS